MNYNNRRYANVIVTYSATVDGVKCTFSGRLYDVCARVLSVDPELHNTKRDPMEAISNAWHDRYVKCGTDYNTPYKGRWMIKQEKKS